MPYISEIQGRITSFTAYNGTGQDIPAKNIVFVNANAYITLASGVTAQIDKLIGVTMDIIRNGEYGRVALFGEVEKVLVDQAATALQFLTTGSTPGSAHPVTAMQDGLFGMALASGATEVPAIIWGRPEASLTLMKPASVIWTYDNALDFASPLSHKIYNNSGFSRNLGKVHLSVLSAPTGADIIVDILKNGTTVFTTPANRPTIAASSLAGFTVTFDDPVWDDTDYLQANIVQYGSSNPGSALTVQLLYAYV